jgi:oligoribonuclease (3'-5' exoribonuclease)
MKLRNYTTQIAVSKTFSEISELLADMGAEQIMADYDGSKMMTAISFRINTGMGLMAYHMPARIDNIHAELQKSIYSKISRSKKTHEQAARIGWRILKDWIHAQMSLIKADQVEIDQVFLPYMQIEGKTLYDHIKDDGLPALGYKR